MRTILFRGQREDTKEWIYGGISPFNDCVDIFDSNSVDNSCYEVFSETVGQFTGLIDPKNNNRKIFEHDIYKSGKLIGIIEWNNTLSQFQLTWQNMSTAADIFSMINSKYTFEHIGNIHDNPELLVSSF